MHFSEIRRSAQNLIEGRANIETVRAEFIEAANTYKFGYLLRVIEADQTPDANSVLFKVANCILDCFDEEFCYTLYSLIDTAKVYLRNKENTINCVDAIFSLASQLDIPHIYLDLSSTSSELAEINKPESSRHLYSDKLLAEFEVQIQSIEADIKPKLVSICEDIIARYEKESADDLVLELE